MNADVAGLKTRETLKLRTQAISLAISLRH
jgi:hypothetical protein